MVTVQLAHVTIKCTYQTNKEVNVPFFPSFFMSHNIVLRRNDIMSQCNSVENIQIMPFPNLFSLW